eukprot:988396-Rhodomonas_salina.6
MGCGGSRTGQKGWFNTVTRAFSSKAATPLVCYAIATKCPTTVACPVRSWSLPDETSVLRKGFPGAGASVSSGGDAGR